MEPDPKLQKISDPAGSGFGSTTLIRIESLFSGGGSGGLVSGPYINPCLLVNEHPLGDRTVLTEWFSPEGLLLATGVLLEHRILLADWLLLAEGILSAGLLPVKELSPAEELLLVERVLAAG
jgi:hypothetical protein